MPGYQLVEERFLNPPSRSGIRRNTRRIGFVDFLKELDQDEFPFDANTKLLVAGLEDVLLFSRPDMEKAAYEIRSKLVKKANSFERFNCDWVQIMFRNKLIRGEHLTVKHPTAVLPIYRIFGTPVSETDENGNESYRCSFNLS